jgi:hypothetical protein
MPMTSEASGMVLPAEISAPAPIRQLRPITAPFITMAPVPTSVLSPTRWHFGVRRKKIVLLGQCQASWRAKMPGHLLVEPESLGLHLPLRVRFVRLGATTLPFFEAR